MFLLDTNACIQFMNGTSTSVRENFQSCAPSEIVVCSVVKAELLFGAKRSQRREDNLARLSRFFEPLRSLPFDDACVEAYGEIRQILTQQGNLIGPNDLFIASIAVSHDAVLVTHNVREFERVPNLQIEDWQV